MTLRMLIIGIFLVSCDENFEPLKTSGETFLVKNEHHSDRAYLKVLPSNYNYQKAYPLLLVFHGAFSDYYDIQKITKFDKHIEDMIIVYPQAKVENWEEGCKCNKPYRLGIDDVDFIRVLVDELEDEHFIYKDNIFAVGYSQGALFVQNLAIKLPGKFNAIAVVAGAMSQPLYNEGQPESAVSVIAIHGDSDDVLPYDGANEGLSPLVSAEDAMGFWAITEDGNPTPIIEQKSSYTKFIYNEGSWRESILYKITNAGHQWPTTKFRATQKIVEYVSSKLK